MPDSFDYQMIFEDHYFELVEHYGDNKELAYQECADTTGWFASSSVCATIIRRFYKDFPEERNSDRKCFVDQAYELLEIHNRPNDW